MALTYIGGTHILRKYCEKRDAQDTMQLGIHTFTQEKTWAANRCGEWWRLVRRSAPTPLTRRYGCAPRACCVSAEHAVHQFPKGSLFIIR